MTQEEMLKLLEELTTSHGPIGDERQVEAVVLREFEATGVKTWQDAMSNIVGHLPGAGPRVMVVAHKDELGMIVTHVPPDGNLRVLPLGGPKPWNMAKGRSTSSLTTAPSCHRCFPSGQHTRAAVRSASFARER